jgi:hypothetical protein
MLHQGKFVSKSSFPNLFPEATPQSCCSSKQLFVNVVVKCQNYSPPRIMFQNCSEKMLPKAASQKSFPK